MLHKKEFPPEASYNPHNCCRDKRIKVGTAVISSVTLLCSRVSPGCDACSSLSSYSQVIHQWSETFVEPFGVVHRKVCAELTPQWFTMDSELHPNYIEKFVQSWHLSGLRWTANYTRLTKELWQMTPSYEARLKTDCSFLPSMGWTQQ